MREEFFDMSWKDKLDEAVKAIKGVAESDMVKNITSKAQETATNLAQKAKAGVLSAADAFVAANADPSTVKIRYLNADLSIISPSDGLEIKRPQGGRHLRWRRQRAGHQRLGRQGLCGGDRRYGYPAGRQQL